MKATYRVLAILIAVGVVLQAASIAYAWFDVLGAVDDGQAFTEDDGNSGHVIHGVIGVIGIPLIALLLLVVSFFAKVPDGVKWAAIVFGVAVLQVALAFVAFSAPAVGALHGINALVLAGVAGRASAMASSPRETSPATTSAA